MEQATLTAQARTDLGTRPSKRLRREGYVPAVVYGRGLDPILVTLDRKELYGVLHTEAGLNAVINVEVSGGEPVLAVAREIQRHPVRGEITHLDLIKVSLTEAIEAEVGLEFIGTPLGVKEDGGFLEAMESSVTIEALPTAIPNVIELDVSGLGIHDILKVEDLPEIEGVTYLGDPERPIVTVSPPAAEEEPEAVDAGLELEGEEGEAAEDADDEDEAGTEDQE